MPVPPPEPAQWLTAAQGTLLPPLLLIGYITCLIGASALANCSLLAVLYKSPTNGLFFILLQIVVADIALGLSIGSEIWSFNTNNWIFGNSACIAYRGLNVFASTATLYFVSTIALHTLASVNNEEKALLKSHRRNDHDEEEEIRSSRHSLVAASDSSTPPRTMNLDYRESYTSIPIKQPSIFVWILSLSLSVPDFVLATTVEVNKTNVICTIVDSSQRLNLYSVLVLFNLILPVVLMLITVALVIVKLCSKTRILLDQCESIAALKLSVWLIIMYLILSSPRSAFTAFNIYLTSLSTNDTFTIDYIQTETYQILGVSFGCSYLASVLLRPLICILLLPSVKKALSYGHRNLDNV